MPKKKVIEAEIVEEKSTNVVPFSPNLPVSKAALDTVSANRKLLTEFIKNQMRKGIDYGVIPGTKVESLYKPGAEKLAKLFNLTIKKEQVDKELDRAGNFAMFTYRATVSHGPSGLELAQCEGSCNSQEKKYKERKVYAPDRSFTIEETPVCDILNTLQKMAQKRAMVGGVIEAVGASDFYTQDIDDDEDAAANGVRSAPPARVAVDIPSVNSAKSQEVRPPQDEAMVCDCGNRMMISKYEPYDWYCGKCKGRKPRE